MELILFWKAFGVECFDLFLFVVLTWAICLSVVFALFLTSIYVLDTTIRFYGLGWESFCDNGWNIFDVIVAFGSFATTMIVQSGSTNSTIQQLQKLFLVCIVFKLVQRTDSLNQLFKTGTCVMIALISIFSFDAHLFSGPACR